MARVVGDTICRPPLPHSTIITTDRPCGLANLCRFRQPRPAARYGGTGAFGFLAIASTIGRTRVELRILSAAGPHSHLPAPATPGLYQSQPAVPAIVAIG